MALIRAHGFPDYFITMTANPKWPEITRELLHGQSAVDRPDLVARVFKLKLAELLKDLTERGVLGKHRAHTYVVEFQKRGLPHAHILLIVADEDKPKTLAEIDLAVSAELPDPVAAPALWERVTTHMFHGPCGTTKKTAPCMNDEGDCTKDYPKEYAETTERVEDGYPIYKRPNNGREFTRSGFRFDNSRIVPYNPYLLQKYNCHLNVEIVNSIRAIKYMFKYTYKGHDRAGMNIEEETRGGDEIRDYLDARYVGPAEAAWRLCEFPMHGKSHTIERLPVHRDGEQQCSFEDDGGEEETPAMEAGLERAQRTRLTEYFAANADAAARLLRDADMTQAPLTPRKACTATACGNGATHLLASLPYCAAHMRARCSEQLRTLYADMPQRSVWNTQEQTWTGRKQYHHGHAVVARMYGVEMTDDRYWLRALLLHIPGAVSFSDLKATALGLTREPAETTEAFSARVGDDATVPWRAAAEQYGLIEQDDEYDRAVEEALHSNANALRYFAYMLVHLDAMPNPQRLWDTHKDALSRDDSSTRDLPDGQRVLATLRRLKTYVDAIDETVWEARGMPRVVQETHEERRDRIFKRRTHVDREAAEEMRRELVDMLNDEQRAAFDDIVSALDGDGALFYIDGPGGSGKTFLYNALMHHCQAAGKIALACAYTGVAATLLPGGVTCHKLVNAPFVLFPDSASRVGAETAEAAILLAADIIVWDEASMTPRDLFTYADRVLRDLTGRPDTPFGGKVVVVGGDWRQVLPIVVSRDPEAAVGASLRKTPLWESGAFRRHTLVRNMRVDNAADGERAAVHRQWLLDVGDGALPRRDDLGPHTVELPRTMCLAPDAITTDLVDFVYQDMETYRRLAEASDISADERADVDTYFRDRAILTPLNEHVDALNLEFLSRLSGEETLTRSRDSIVEDDVDGHTYPTELLNKLNPPGCAPHELKLKKGAVVLLTHNIDRERGLCNGTRAIVVSVAARVLVVRVLTGRAKGQTVELPRTRQTMEGTKTKMPFKIRRVQFPVKLAWAMTINKAQGQTLCRAGIYLPAPVFSHGQLYVACSRVGSPDQLRFLVTREDDSPIWHGWLEDPADADNTQKVFTSNVVCQAALDRNARPAGDSPEAHPRPQAEPTAKRAKRGDAGDVPPAPKRLPRASACPSAEPAAKRPKTTANRDTPPTPKRLPRAAAAATGNNRDTLPAPKRPPRAGTAESGGNRGALPTPKRMSRAVAAETGPEPQPCAASLPSPKRLPRAGGQSLMLAALGKGPAPPTARSRSGKADKGLDLTPPEPPRPTPKTGVRPTPTTGARRGSGLYIARASPKTTAKQQPSASPLAEAAVQLD